MSDLVPPAIAKLSGSAAEPASSIVQQCRPEDMDRVRDSLCADRRRGGARAVLRRPAGADRRGASRRRRSGASTVAELSVIGRPAIMVPLAPCARPGPEGQCRGPGAGRRRLDGRAARHDAGTARRRPRRADRPSRPARRRRRRRPRLIGRPDAVERLADLVETRGGRTEAAQGRSDTTHEDAARYRTDAFRRHRRHRHERHRRGAGQSRLSRAGLRRRRERQRAAAARARASGGDRP